MGGEDLTGSEELTGRRCPRAGSAMVELLLTTIPLLFAVVSLVWLSLGMWQYESLAEAVQATARSAAVHGAGCAGQTCATTVAQTVQTLAGKAIGIPASQLSVTLTSSASTLTCNPVTTCYANAAAWPSLAGNTAVTTDILVAATFPFTSPIAMWVPGQGSVRFAAMTLGAQSRQMVVY